MAKRATRHFYSGAVSSPRKAKAGEIYPDDHPLVRAHPDMFEDVDTYVSRVYPEFVETASAEPGVKRRGPGRPPKVRKAETDPESSEDSEKEES